MSFKKLGVTLLAGLAISVVNLAQAVGFEQTMTCDESGPYACDPDQAAMPVHWNSRCVNYQMGEGGSDSVVQGNDDIADVDALRDEVRRSFAAWTAVGCSDMTLVDGGLTDVRTSGIDSGETPDDTNMVVWRDENWTDFASAEAFALTSVTFNPNSGVIADADIEFNTDLYDFSITEDPLPNHVDVRNTMTHEVGHFIGLDHTDEADATMFATAPVGETAKRHLHQDDVEGVCHIYPSTERSHADCEGFYGYPGGEESSRPDNAGCSTSDGATPPNGVALLLVSLCGLGLWRRSKSVDGEFSL